MEEEQRSVSRSFSSRKRKKSEFLLVLPRSPHLHRDWNDGEELLVACELASVVDLLPKGEVVVLSLIVVHRSPFLPVKQVERDLRGRQASTCVASAKKMASWSSLATYRVVDEVDVSPR